MTDSERREKCEKAVDAIIYDLSDRRGLSGEWDGIDDDIKAQIRTEWIRLVMIALLDRAEDPKDGK